MSLKLNKLTIISETGHFGKFLGYDDRCTYPVPPPSTVIGMLQTIYSRDIDNFKFGYIFKSKQTFKDDITIHKKGHKVKSDATDIRFIELHDQCELKIYTDLDEDVKLDYILCMGRAGNIARLKFPIQTAELVDKVGEGKKQFTSKGLGSGRIDSVNLKSEYVGYLDSYDHQVGQLRYNISFESEKFRDETEKQNIFMWEVTNGKVGIYND